MNDCTSCRGRFLRKPNPAGLCEVCATLDRLNRVILTRHPAEQSDVLLGLLQRTVAKVEGFIEDWEANTALGGQFRVVGTRPLGETSEQSGGKEPTGLQPCSKKGHAAEKEQRAKADRIDRERSPKDSKAAASSKRSRSPRKLKERGPEKTREKSREKSRKEKKKKKESEEEIEEEPEVREPRKTKKTRDIEDSEESSTREDKKSPCRREENDRKDFRGDRRPRSPTHSPPGYPRREPEYGHDDSVLERKDKPKKFKGQKWVERGYKQGYNKGKGKGKSHHPSSRWWQ